MSSTDSKTESLISGDSSQLFKKIKVDCDINKSDLISKVLHKNNDDDSENNSEVSELTQNMMANQSKSVVKPNHYDFGVLSTFFPSSRKSPDKFEIKAKSRLKTVIVNYSTSSSKIHPYLPLESKSADVDDEMRYFNIVNKIYTFQDFINKRNIEGATSIINEICLEDCLLKTPALSTPKVGRDYIIELFHSIFSNSIIKNTINIYRHEKVQINGCCVLLFHHAGECTYIF